MSNDNIDMVEEPQLRDIVLMGSALIVGIMLGQWMQYDYFSGPFGHWQPVVIALVGLTVIGILRLAIPYDATIQFSITRKNKQQ